jgi:hypothetical protein
MVLQGMVGMTSSGGGGYVSIFLGNSMEEFHQWIVALVTAIMHLS